MKLDDLDIQDIGGAIQLAGAIWASGDTVYLIPLPDALTQAQKVFLEPPVKGRRVGPNGTIHTDPVNILDMNLVDWQRFIQQTDLRLVEVKAAHPEDAQKTVRALVRKCERQISQRVSWAVFKRDGYRCRYCAADSVPLTVDHVVLWEDGGPSIEENLVACCKKCNKTRANTPYPQWLKSSYYRKVSRNLIMVASSANEALVSKLDTIPRMLHKPKKRK